MFYFMPEIWLAINIDIVIILEAFLLDPTHAYNVTIVYMSIDV